MAVGAQPFRTSGSPPMEIWWILHPTCSTWYETVLLGFGIAPRLVSPLGCLPTEMRQEGCDGRWFWLEYCASSAILSCSRKGIGACKRSYAPNPRIISRWFNDLTLTDSHMLLNALSSQTVFPCVGGWFRLYSMIKVLNVIVIIIFISSGISSFRWCRAEC